MVKLKLPVMQSTHHAKIIYWLSKTPSNSYSLANGGFGKTQGILYTQLKDLKDAKLVRRNPENKKEYMVNKEQLTKRFINFALKQFSSKGSRSSKEYKYWKEEGLRKENRHLQRFLHNYLIEYNKNRKDSYFNVPLEKLFLRIINCADLTAHEAGEDMLFHSIDDGRHELEEFFEFLSKAHTVQYEQDNQISIKCLEKMQN